MSNTGSIHCYVGHEINTDQLDGQNRCHLHADERKKMDTAIRSKYRYHQHQHVHFQGGHSQQTHNVNTTLYNVIQGLFLQRCEKDMPATLLQRKVQRCIPTCSQRCEKTLYLRCICHVIFITLQQRCGGHIYTTCRWQHCWKLLNLKDIFQ